MLKDFLKSMVDDPYLAKVIFTMIIELSKDKPDLENLSNIIYLYQALTEKDVPDFVRCYLSNKTVQGVKDALDDLASTFETMKEL